MIFLSSDINGKLKSTLIPHLKLVKCIFKAAVLKIIVKGLYSFCFLLFFLGSKDDKHECEGNETSHHKGSSEHEKHEKLTYKDQ